MNLSATLSLYAQYPLQGRAKWCGMDVSIENKKGSVRKGVSNNGKSWSIRMAHDYGYLRKTLSPDDNQHFDVFMGPHPDTADTVYVVDTNKLTKTGQWVGDEQKAMIGFTSPDEAKRAFLKNYTDPRFFGKMTSMPVADFVAKVKKTKDNPQRIAARANNA